MDTKGTATCMLDRLPGQCTSVLIFLCNMVMKLSWDRRLLVAIYTIPQGDSILWLLMFDVSMDWAKKCQILYLQTLGIRTTEH